MRCAHAHLAVALLGANKAPRQLPPHPCFAPLVACANAQACKGSCVKARLQPHLPEHEPPPAQADVGKCQPAPFKGTRASACGERGIKGLRGSLAGRLVGVGGAQGGAGLPLACGQGMASMFEPEGRVAQPPTPYEHAESSPAESGTANIEARPEAPSDPAPRCPDKAPAPSQAKAKAKAQKTQDQRNSRTE